MYNYEDHTGNKKFIKWHAHFVIIVTLHLTPVFAAQLQI